MDKKNVMNEIQKVQVALDLLRRVVSSDMGEAKVVNYTGGSSLRGASRYEDLLICVADLGSELGAPEHSVRFGRDLNLSWGPREE